jgi:hypothetical protein
MVTPHIHLVDNKVLSVYSVVMKDSDSDNPFHPADMADDPLRNFYLVTKLPDERLILPLES